MKKARFWLVLVLLLGIAVPASAAEPYANYNFNKGFVSQEPQAYTLQKVLDSYTIGIETLDNIPFKNPSDFVISRQDGIVALADTGNNRIIVMDLDFKVLQIIGNQPKEFTQNEETGETVAGEGKYFPAENAKVYPIPISGVQEKSKEFESFNLPSGVFFSGDGSLYVCDTKNRRVVRFFRNEEGQFVCDAIFKDPDIARYVNGISGAPDETPTGEEPGENPEENPGENPNPGAQDEKFTYEPKAVVVDEGNRMYVVVDGCYQGLVELSSDGSFTKFVGATKTTATISAIWRRLISQKQREALAASLSTEYTNAYLDADGMIFGTVGNIKTEVLMEHFMSKSEIGAAIKRIAPTGTDILKRNDVYPPSGDRGYDTSMRERWSFFVDICVADDGIYSALDRNKGRIFTYNPEGELLYIFGAMGNVNGAFTQPVALDLLDQSTIGVLDSQTAQITIFELTDFGQKIRNATLLQTDRSYDEAMSLWREVLSESSNSRLAYTNIARIQYIRGEYEACCENYARAFNQSGYAEAYAKMRNERLEVLMPYVMTGLVVLILFFVGKGVFKRMREFIKKKGRSN